MPATLMRNRTHTYVPVALSSRSCASVRGRNGANSFVMQPFRTCGTLSFSGRTGQSVTTDRPVSATSTKRMPIA